MAWRWSHQLAALGWWTKVAVWRQVCCGAGLGAIHILINPGRRARRARRIVTGGCSMVG
ncbi:hypothetical protein PR003_g24596 [Phytophthora rubi]|uniref:Uncharacterized protein n=1 Tax=Phytophthora rubi TaxID=129364 RepID=A0A6A3IQQ6_9STRA|nr:hypothetical protein PR002_g23760 [Phytophthora rubi]KAE8983088.1 hypothetical protein PR001_g23546 [Phytophthora rubi]KAE9293067.1 hypothetical protein PR003_g24596 [Phytophthora rubi]